MSVDEWVELIPWHQNEIKLFGKTYPEPRLTSWFGPPYRYSGISWKEKAMPPELENIRRKLSDMLCFPFNSVLCNYYRDGQDSMSWHSDNEPEMDQELIASLSIGGTRTFRFRKKGMKHSSGAQLEHGSLLVMQNFQSLWQHSIPKSKKECAPRINLTFRRIAR
ncbi:MAG: hypothetical protein RL220_36 [Bacteroidota bacterium]